MWWGEEVKGAYLPARLETSEAIFRRWGSSGSEAGPSRTPLGPQVYVYDRVLRGCVFL